MIRSKQSLDGRGKAIGRFRRAAGLALAGLWLGVTAKAQIPVPDANWTHRTNIIFYGYDRGETLTNFPALVVLSTNVAGFSYEQFASPSGYDLRFANADETEGLPCEIEQWAANGRSYVWVKVPELTNSATVWAYWGNTNATAQQAYTTNGAAWDAGFRGVWHLSESAGTTAFDSTANRNYGAKKSAGEPAALAGGVVGGGQRWDGSDDFIDIPSAASLDMGAALTCSAWVRWDGGAVPDWPSLASRFEGTPNAWHIQLTTAHSGTNYPDKDNTLTIQSENYTPGSGEIDVTNTVPSWSSAAWYHVTVVFSNGPVSVYRDGVYRGGGTILPVQDNGATITLGHRSTHPTWGCVWNGAQDEVRLAAGARSSNWIWASYMTMASNAAFTSFGSIPPPPQNPPQIGNSIGATGVTANAAFLNGSLTSTGTAATAVWSFLGTNPLAATNKGDWATNVFVGADQDVGVKTVGVADLTTDSTYYYRSYASNDAGEAWAPASAIFITGEVTVQATDSNAWETGPDNGVFTVSRPAGTTNEALTVSYTLSGTATSGADYEALPGSVVIPAGATHATVTVKPIDDLTFNETNETVILTLVSGGAYPVGPPGSAQMTIADNEVLQKGFYRMKITFSGYDRGEALLNFPVLVVFSNGMGGSDFSFTNHPFLTTSGYDLRFLDATESFNLPYEIEHWNSNGPCHVWVRAPAIAAPTDYIWATWADPAHTNQETYTTNGQVWSAGYGAVWHIAQANPIDSVSTNDGTQYDGVTLISTGRVDGADSFDGTDMRIDTPYLQNAVTAYTAEAWVKTTDSDPLRPIVQNRDGGTDDDPANSLTLGFGRTFGAARMAALRGIHGSYWTKRTS